MSMLNMCAISAAGQGFASIYLPIILRINVWVAEPVRRFAPQMPYPEALRLNIPLI